MNLEPREYDVIAHALGLSGTYDRFKPRRRWAYRNYFAAAGKDVDTWRGLVVRGLACTLRPVDPDNETPGFAVTHDGAVAAGLRSYVPAKIIARPLPASNNPRGQAMPNPIPSEISAITDPDVQTVEDWKRRTAAAKDLLIQRHGYKPEDFYTVSEDDEPCLDGWSKYPAEWIERSGFVADSAIPRGLVIHCPPGVDVTGEAHSEHDPIYLLADCEFWASRTDDEMRALCDAPR